MLLSYSIIGLIFCLFILTHQKVSKLSYRYTGFFILLVSYILISYFFYDWKFMGEVPWYNKTPWKETIFFIIMIIGMIASVLIQAIKQRKKEIEDLKKSREPFEIPKLVIDKYELLLPFLSSGVTFLGLLSKVDGRSLSLITITLCFETGFFWQTIIKR